MTSRALFNTYSATLRSDLRIVIRAWLILWVNSAGFMSTAHLHINAARKPDTTLLAWFRQGRCRDTTSTRLPVSCAGLHALEKLPVMAKNAFYAQSGGVTAVINTTACGVIETARKHKNKIGKVYAGRNGIIGALREELIDTS